MSKQDRIKAALAHIDLYDELLTEACQTMQYSEDFRDQLEAHGNALIALGHRNDARRRLQILREG